MKIVFTFIFALGTSLVFSQTVMPTEIDKLLKDPPLIINRFAHEAKSFRMNSDDSVIIKGPRFIAFLMFDFNPEQKVTSYRFWAFSKDTRLQVRGEGELYEEYWEVSRIDPSGEEGPSAAVDRGSKTTIHAGLFLMEWSKGDFLYYAEGFSVEKGTFDDYRRVIRG
jgi:hypothetical protein